MDNIFKNKKMTDKAQDDEILLSQSSRTVSDTEYGDDDKKYLISFKLNDTFKPAKSHVCEVTMLYTYAPDEEMDSGDDAIYLAIQIDDAVYCAVEEFKESGSFASVIEITPLSGRFYFKAKMEYDSKIMYFYGLDRCEGFWENNGLCIVYPKEYLGTESEKKLMSVLDEAAQSYRETLQG